MARERARVRTQEGFGITLGRNPPSAAGHRFAKRRFTRVVVRSRGVLELVQRGGARERALLDLKDYVAPRTMK